jgi:hypothetical protein
MTDFRTGFITILGKPHAARAVGRRRSHQPDATSDPMSPRDWDGWKITWLWFRGGG